MMDWIDNEAGAPVGTVGFLIERCWVMQRGRTRLELRDRPAQTNMSLRDRLYGWCGTTNDVAVHAEGMARIVRTCRNGRAQVARIRGEELTAALTAAGYPDLVPQEDR